MSQPDALAAASVELRQLAASLRERGDLASYRSVIYGLAALSGPDVVTVFGGAADARKAGYMSIGDYCARTGRKANTVRRAVREGRMPGVKSGSIWLVSAP